MFITTVKLSFYLDNLPGSHHLINIELLIIINISFLLDILFSFNTGIY